MTEGRSAWSAQDDQGGERHHQTGDAFLGQARRVFGDRVAPLTRLGVPTSKDIQSLMKRVEALNDSVQALSGATPAKAREAPAARKAPAKKAARRTKAAS